MFQVVAVVKEETGVVAEPDQNPNPFAGHEQHRVLPAVIHIAFMQDAPPFKNLKLFSMQVDGMGMVPVSSGPVANLEFIYI